MRKPLKTLRGFKFANFLKLAFCNGIKFGRRKIGMTDTFPSVYQEWKQPKITAVEAMKRLGMKRNTFYRRVKEYESNL